MQIAHDEKISPAGNPVFLNAEWLSDDKTVGVRLTAERNSRGSSSALRDAEAEAFASGECRRARGLANRVRNYLSANRGEPVSLAGMAECLKASPREFGRAFLRVTGERLSRRITAHKMELACNFLLSPHIPLAQIARTCGFQSLARFEAAFFDRVGVTPVEYRNRIQERLFAEALAVNIPAPARRAA